MVPSVTSAFSAAKMPEASEDLERLLFSFKQRRGVGPDSAEGVCPLRARRTLRVKAECRRVEQNPLALDLLDHRPLRKHVLKRLPARQAPPPRHEGAEPGGRGD